MLILPGQPEKQPPKRLSDPRTVEVSSTKTVVHVLYRGKALCGFHHNSDPRAWPAGHVFVRPNAGQLTALANCTLCMRLATSIPP